MKKLDILILGVLLLSVMSCGPEEQEVLSRTAAVDQPVQLEVQSELLAEDDMVEWNFTELPSQVSDVSVEFRPSRSSPQVSFIPPDSGTYRLNYTVMNASGRALYVQPYVIRANLLAPREDMGQESSPGEAGSAGNQSSQMRSGTTSGSSSESQMADVIPRYSDELTVQISAWKTFSKAESMANRARELGYNPYIQRAEFPNGEVWYRVRVGQFNTYAAAQTLLNKLRNESAYAYHDLWIDYRREDT